MKAVILLITIVGCYGIKWKLIEEFKDLLQDYRKSALQATASIEGIINSSRADSIEFLEDIYRRNSLLTLVTNFRSIDNECYKKMLKKDNLVLSFKIHAFQLEVPLQSRIIDILDRINDMNTTIDTYQTLADSRFTTCQLLNYSCAEEANQWLVSSVNSLSCNLQPSCNNHSIGKRSVCSKGLFRCTNISRCIPGEYYCDGGCDCGGCTDEPLGCQKYCNEYRCEETFRCISKTKRCDGKDDCGDGSDEQNCPTTTTPAPTSYHDTTSYHATIYYHGNCSIDAGDFLCSPNKCIKIEQVCDGFYDCDDGSDEGELCKDRQCSPDCSKRGGVCLSGPKGPQCLYECPPGMFETSAGCSLRPEAPLPTLAQVIDDTPRLLSRHSARYNYLKMKTIEEISKSMREFVRCRREEFTLLSKVARFSSDETWSASGNNAVDQLTSSNPPIIETEPNNLSSVTNTHTFQSLTTEATTTDPFFFF